MFPDRASKVFDVVRGEGPIPRPATARESNELDRLARKESGRERIEGPVLFLDRSTAR